MTFKMVIGDGNGNGNYMIHPNFKTVTVSVILEKWILKSNKTAGNNFDLNGIFSK